MAETKKPINVLVVDDEQFFAEWLAENLQDQPGLYNARWVNSGERALEWIQQQPVDLVISDIKMAGVSGIELLKQIRRHHPSIGVILMTGYALPELQQEAVKRGSLFYLEKPFPMERLESAIEQAMANRPAQDRSAAGETGGPESTTQFSLLDTLHLFHLSRANKTLLVRAGTSDGLIYYQDGEVVHAVTQDQTGEPAFQQILSWQSNDYAVFTDEPPPTRTIFRDFDILLSTATQPGSMPAPTAGIAQQRQSLDGSPDAPQPLQESPAVESWPAEQLPDELPLTVMHQEAQQETLMTAPMQESDSTQAPQSAAPPPSEQPKVEEHELATGHAPQAEPSGTQMMPTLSNDDKRQVEELLMASDHLEGGMLLTVNGSILVSKLPPHGLSSDVLADAGSLFEMCRRLAGQLGRGHHRQSFIQGELGNIIISDAGGDAFLLFVTNAKATLGLALLQARQRAQKVGQIMANYA